MEEQLAPEASASILETKGHLEAQRDRWAKLQSLQINREFKELIIDLYATRQADLALEDMLATKFSDPVAHEVAEEQWRARKTFLSFLEDIEIVGAAATQELNTLSNL